MPEIIARTEKWGNSIGIIIPKETVREHNIMPEQDIEIHIRSKPVTKVKDIFGKWKFKKPTEQLMREVDEFLDMK